MRQEHIVDEARKPGKVGCHHPQVIVHFAGQRVGLQNFGQAGDQLAETLGIVAVVGGERHRDHHHQIEPELLPVDLRLIARNEALSLQAGAAARALRGRKGDALR
ncbi:hypothetical protein D3C87_1856850 [compost metagenome]